VALPSLVTVGSLAFVVAAGAGLAGVSADAVLQTLDGSSAGSRSGVATDKAAGPRRAQPMATAATQTLQRRTSSRAHPEGTPHVLVEVYNSSGISGLAAAKAGLLEGAGWNVAATDNWYGNIPANTVYYPPHLRSAAIRLAKTLDVQRLQPAVAPMRFDRLTVIYSSS
jgi:LytR cell envelope-related transcriptional attenuator